MKAIPNAPGLEIKSATSAADRVLSGILEGTTALDFTQ
jgi:hypothetical protein